MKEKSILASFSRYTSRNVIAMIGLSCYILADTFFIANGVGAEGLTALNLALPIYSLISGVGLMTGVGGATKYTINKAQGNDKEANKVFSHAVIFGGLVGILTLLIGIFFSAPLSWLLGSDETTFALTNMYMKTVMCFAPAFIINNILVSFLRNDDSPNLAMTAMLAGSGANIILDYIFVYPLGMGMFGAAFATGIAPITSMLVMAGHFIKKKNQFHFVKVKVQFHYIRTILSLGSASFITEISSGIVLLLFNIVILKLEGNTGVAAYGIIANLAIVATSIFTGIAQGIQPLVSTEYGRGELANVKQVLRMASVLIIVFAACIYAGIVFFKTPIIMLFNRDQDQLLTAIAKSGISLYFIGFFCSGFNIVLAAFFGATERPVFSFLISILRGGVILIPVLIVMSAGFGMSGVWLVYPITELLTLGAALIMKKRA